MSQCPLCQEKDAEIRRLRRRFATALRALDFARSTIKDGQPWTDACEAVIGGAIYNFPPDFAGSNPPPPNPYARGAVGLKPVLPSARGRDLEDSGG